MKHKRVTRKLAAVGGAICLSLSMLASPIASTPVQAAPAQDEAVTPQSDIIYWLYKSENGNLYKRLYNASIGVWIGDWIFVRELPKKGGGNV